MLLGGACALVLGTLFKFRILPFLKGDTILSGGRPMPTEEVAEFGARWFCIFGSASILSALIWGPSEPAIKKHEHPIAERTGCSEPLLTMLMKMIAAITALFAVLLFAGCSKPDSSLTG